MEKIIERIFYYQKKTRVHFHPTQRHSLFKTLHVPDMRGFSPHLRTVNLNTKQKNDLWIVHDLLHIIFYDFASYHLGEDLWYDENRFYENHLASEAFAVLVLDYHLLSFSKKGGLAVDIKASQWRSFQKLNPDLPPLLSPEFSELLLKLYLSGNCEELLAPKSRKDYDKWIGYELRYSAKQRTYVHSWWNDLHLRPQDGKSITLDLSDVHFAVWDLLDLLIYKPDTEWKNWCKKIAAPIEQKNYFSSFPKFSKVELRYDFRFMDFHAINHHDILKILENAKTPQPETLFLFWQILSETKTSDFKTKIKKLALLSQTSSMNKTLWENVRQICMREFQNFKYKADKKLLASFFLA